MKICQVLDRFGRLVDIIVAALCLLGLAACGGRDEGLGVVINHEPGNAAANHYALALESVFSSSESVPEAQMCRVHLIDVRNSFDQAGGERVRVYFVFADHQGVVMSADTCGLPMNECVTIIAERSRVGCRKEKGLAFH
ncbi:TPA: hypothetical protein UMF67_003111 [Stenotrophomonas maltophilia]|uniref:hypothetical protein n=1 Tax=Stenotrophomonas maltophilia TaxID=40324 RepID=UPI001F53DC25|nr:hypothetical protein [Stenotrophomonas maltophilia]MBN4992642.1 hypothetical protein [Stenotrophomonas maltophilia]MCI1130964.1 hypothetical protein [Stenotrophomonas maltophilia]MCI1149393.1 hypothetical protein [Stenotrophomonas maltophilia]HEL3159357.1 hypothetical protein [Stenotrophomonas maltophilia]HEL3819597.1 hypothetical protein [Stenotrophomonas maltophilia]